MKTDYLGLMLLTIIILVVLMFLRSPQWPQLKKVLSG